MNAHRHVRNIAWRICAAAVLCSSAAGVSAQTIYRNLDGSGNIAYSDRPDTTPPSLTAAAQNSDVTKAPDRISGVSSRRAAALVDANEAARRLRQAQLKRKQGIEPMPGEKVQGALSHRYWQRQEALRRAVENARRRAGETSQPQLAER